MAAGVSASIMVHSVCVCVRVCVCVCARACLFTPGQCFACILAAAATVVTFSSSVDFAVFAYYSYS